MTDKNKGYQEVAPKITYTNDFTPIYSHSLEVQRQTVLSALTIGPKTTIQLRHEFNVMMPAVRIKKLRDEGHRIEAYLVNAVHLFGTEQSRIALYSLVEGGAA
ncbi:MAG: helix-turn-helix domain-containing protein [Azonexus sp.]